MQPAINITKVKSLISLTARCLSNTRDPVCPVMLNVNTEKVITDYFKIEKHAHCIRDKTVKFLCTSHYFNSIAYKPTNGVAVPRLLF